MQSSLGKGMKSAQVAGRRAMPAHDTDDLAIVVSPYSSSILAVKSALIFRLRLRELANAP